MSTQASSRLKRLQIMALLFLLVAGIINFLDRTSLSIANTTIREEMGLTATEMGLLLSVFSFGYALCQLPIGMVMERFGVKRVYGFGIFLWSVAQTALGFVGSFGQMIVARVVLGIGEAPHLPTGVKVVNDWYNIRKRGLPMGIVNMSSTLAQALAPPLLIALMLTFGWRAMFIIIGVSGILLSILWMIFYRNREDANLSPQDIAHLEEETPPSSKEKVTLKDWAGLFIFGMNLSETRMSGGGQVEELRRALDASKARVIIIDPRYTDSVIAEHAEWLPIRPTTDAALVAGLAHTLISENLIDEALVNQYCVGYDRSTLPENAAPNASYKDYVMGTGEDGIEKTAQWAAQITGIPATRIQQLAREIAAARACYIGQGWGPQRHANGEQTVRAIQTLPALTGHFGLPGTNNGNWPYGTPYGVPLLPTGTNPVKASIPCYLWTDAIQSPEKMTATTMGVKGVDKLNVGIKLFFNQAGNALLNQHGDINRTRKIIADESLCETIIVIENHMTPSAKYADLLLPETSYLEAEDLVDSSYAAGSHNYMIALQKTITPMWEVRSTYDICADIAGHLGLREQYTEGRTQAQWAEYHYQQIREKRPYLPEWSVAKEKGVIDQQIATERQSIAFIDFREDATAHPLDTPSGKIEIYSQALADLAQKWTLPEGDRIPAVPEFCVVKESHLNKELTAKYPLQLSGFHTKGHTHSTYTNVLALHEAVPDEVWINPIDASARQLSSGDIVHVFNDRGVVEIPCKVTNRILPGVAAMPQGAWTRLDKQGVDVGGCINSLTSHLPSPLAKGNPQHTNLVEIKRA